MNLQTLDTPQVEANSSQTPESFVRKDAQGNLILAIPEPVDLPDGTTIVLVPHRIISENARPRFCKPNSDGIVKSLNVGMGGGSYATGVYRHGEQVKITPGIALIPCNAETVQSRPMTQAEVEAARDAAEAARKANQAEAKTKPTRGINLAEYMKGTAKGK